MSTKVRVEHVYKVFGPSPDEAVKLLEGGADKDTILRETGNIVGVADATFEVEQGHIFMVMGLSGSGKSTLIRCLNRLIYPTSGKVYIDDQDVVALDDDGLRELRRTKMAMVFQHFALFPHKTVVENVEYGLKVRGVVPGERREKALETLTAVGLEGWGDRYPENLSGGMQQRVGLARALATDPEILLMDEAFSALDPLIRREMQDELIELQRQVHKTIVFITHDLSEALKMGDRVAVMKDGRIIQIGNPQEIVSGPADEYVAAFTQDVDRGRVFTVSSIMRDVDTLVQGHDSVRTAMFRMRASGRDTFYVVQPHPQHRCLGGIVGMATSQDIAKAVREGVQDLSQVMRTDIPKASPATPLVDIYTMFSAGLPVAVVDEQGCLFGEVDQLDLLANLAPENLLVAPGPAHSESNESNGAGSHQEENPSGDSTVAVG
jgi:glycine betaine/proline transport system ATP-binding protein